MSTSRPCSLQDGLHAREEACGVAQVLDEIAAEDDIEGRRLERQLQLLDVADDDVLANVARRDAAASGSRSIPTTVQPRSTSGRAR